MASASEYLKRKDIAESHFLMSFLFIQCNKDSCYEHIGVNICLYECFSLLASECAVCLCVSAWDQIRGPAKNYKLHYLKALSKLIVCTFPPPFWWEQRGVEAPTKFSKRGRGFTGPQILESGCEERRGIFLGRRW